MINTIPIDYYIWLAAVLFTIGLGIVPGGFFSMAQQAAAALFR